MDVLEVKKLDDANVRNWTVSRGKSGWSKIQHFDTVISSDPPLSTCRTVYNSQMTVNFDQWPSKLAQKTVQVGLRSSIFELIVHFTDRPLSSFWIVHLRPDSENSTLNRFLSKISGSATWHILSTNIQFIILTIVICIYKLFSVNCFCSTQDHICGWFHSFRLNEL